MASKLQNMWFNVHRQIYTLELAPGLFHEPYAKADTLTTNQKKNKKQKKQRTSNGSWY